MPQVGTRRQILTKTRKRHAADQQRRVLVHPKFEAPHNVCLRNPSLACDPEERFHDLAAQNFGHLLPAFDPRGCASEARKQGQGRTPTHDTAWGPGEVRKRHEPDEDGKFWVRRPERIRTKLSKCLRALHDIWGSKSPEVLALES